MNKKLTAFEKQNAQLVVLTPEIAFKAEETTTKNGSQFLVLLDEDLETARQYGLVFKLDEPIVPIYRDMLKIVEYNGNDSMELPLPATYVIDNGGVIRYAFLDADYTQRADPDEVVAEVEKLA